VEEQEQDEREEKDAGEGDEDAIEALGDPYQTVKQHGEGEVERGV